MNPKPTATSTKPDTTAATKPADPLKPGNGNGSPATTAATTAAEPGDPDGNEATEQAQPGKRPLTVMVSEKTYRNLRVLAASEGSNVSAVVVEAVEGAISTKLKAALAALAKDLG